MLDWLPKEGEEGYPYEEKEQDQGGPQTGSRGGLLGSRALPSPPTSSTGDRAAPPQQRDQRAKENRGSHRTVSPPSSRLPLAGPLFRPCFRGWARWARGAKNGVDMPPHHNKWLSLVRLARLARSLESLPPAHGVDEGIILYLFVCEGQRPRSTVLRRASRKTPPGIPNPNSGEPLPHHPRSRVLRKLKQPSTGFHGSQCADPTVPDTEHHGRQFTTESSSTYLVTSSWARRIAARDQVPDLPSPRGGRPSSEGSTISGFGIIGFLATIPGHP